MNTLQIWQSCASKPLGKWFFSKLFCFNAPYFGTIKPIFDEVRPEFCSIRLKKRRSVQNHLSSVHAIAMCNLAEAAGGTMTEVTVPPTHRWIPKGMTVEYLQKATTDLKAIATPLSTPDWENPGEYPVGVSVTDENNKVVFRATINMWISKKKP